jgi:hypothetical protein
MENQPINPEPAGAVSTYTKLRHAPVYLDLAHRTTDELVVIRVGYASMVETIDAELKMREELEETPIDTTGAVEGA